jgi:hypothetical protein
MIINVFSFCLRSLYTQPLIVTFFPIWSADFNSSALSINVMSYCLFSTYKLALMGHKAITIKIINRELLLPDIIYKTFQFFSIHFRLCFSEFAKAVIFQRIQ